MLSVLLVLLLHLHHFNSLCALVSNYCFTVGFGSVLSSVYQSPVKHFEQHQPVRKVPYKYSLTD